jgi:broad specificity phosphatase PhoE
MPDWPELYFIRHGQTDWNAEGRYQGQRDIPLNAIGRTQADANGQLLRALMARDGREAHDYDWYVSPLSRAVETVERVLAAFAPPHPVVTSDPRLVEISFGALEGRLHADILDAVVTAPGRRDEAFWHHRPEGGENYDDLTQRVVAFGSRLDGPAVIVAHGGVLRVIRHLVEGASRADVVNWSTPQDVVYRFSDGRMTAYPAEAAWID